MKSFKYKLLTAVIGIILILYLSVYGAGRSVSVNKYSISPGAEGGYLIHIDLSIREWKLISAEGISPKNRDTFAIEIVGEGKDWSYSNQTGYFYSLDSIKSVHKGWDLGYAWVDAEKENLYLNLYWVKAPDSIIASDVEIKSNVVDGELSGLFNLSFSIYKFHTFNYFSQTLMTM